MCEGVKTAGISPCAQCFNFSNKCLISFPFLLVSLFLLIAIVLYSLRGAASYRNEDGVTALYMDGNGSYADTPSLNLFTFPAFKIMFWVKILEPSQRPSHLYSDWSAPHHFAILVLNPSKTVVFKLRDNLGNDLVNCPSE